MKEITSVALQERIEAGERLNLIDVREPEEVAGGQIEGIINIPLGLLEFRMNELDKSKEYFMICQAGGRSGQAANFLQGQGFDVTNMIGGMNNWQGEVK